MRRMLTNHENKERYDTIAATGHANFAMPRFQILSDLHLEHRPWLGEEITLRQDVDGALLAGDIAAGTDAIAWIARRRPIGSQWQAYYLPGNHEPYGHTIERLHQELATAAQDAGVALLAPGTRDIAGVRLIGATLWTDYTTRFRDPREETAAGLVQQDMLAIACYRALNDFRWIHTDGRLITPTDVLAWHARDRAFLEAELARAAKDRIPAVVMTHHAPVRQSIAPAYDGSPVTAAFVSDLDEMVRSYRPVAWIHGHTHTSFAYRHAGCLVICNPAGYNPRENPNFDPNLILEVDPERRRARLVQGA